MQRTAARRRAFFRRRSARLCQALLSLWACGASLFANADSPLDEAAQRERAAAVAAARTGDVAGGLARLERLQAANPDSQALLFDRIAVSGWANADADVLALGLPLGSAAAPDFVQLAVAKAARNARRFDVAIDWYMSAAAQRPADVQARLGLLLSYGDAGNAGGVRSTLATLSADERTRTDVQLARGYALRSTGAAMEALDAYDRVLATTPDHAEALRGRALSLRALLLSEQALALAREHPGTLTPAEIARLEVDELAVRSRLTARTPYVEPLATERAAALAQELETFDASRADAAAQRALTFDRVVVLADSGRAAEAIAVFESVPGSLEAADPYVLRAAADAYLEAQRPEDARRVIQAGLAKAPSHLELNFSLVYAEMDLQNFDEAFALTRKLVGDLPPVNQQTGSIVAKANDEHMRAELLAGVAESYGDQLGAAQARFERLLAGAPNNPHVRHELANVYRWRGWLDQSLFEYRQVLAVVPDLLSAQVGYAHAQLDARDFAAVDATVTDLTALYPHELATERLAERWRIHNLSELDVDASVNRSSGATFGSSGYAVDTRWFTRPKFYRYRGFVHLYDGSADFPEGDGNRRRAGVGVETRLPRFTTRGEVTGDRSGGDAGLAGQADWRIADQWALGALAEIDSNSVPLRGQRIGVTADQVGATATWARNELSAVSLGWRELDLSDDNRQRSLYADGRYRFINRPNWKLDVTGTLSAGRSRRNDVVYFSPLRDSAVWGGLAFQQRLYRRYERSVVHNAAVRVGRYDQDGFDAGSVWQAQYDVDWRLSQTLAFGIGVRRTGQYYDGVLERTTTALLNVNARF